MNENEKAIKQLRHAATNLGTCGEAEWSLLIHAISNHLAFGRPFVRVTITRLQSMIEHLSEQ